MPKGFCACALVGFAAALFAGCSADGGGRKTATVTGTVNYLQSAALPPGAELYIALEDVSLQDAPAGLIAERTIPAKGREAPIPFAIEYDPKVIEDSHAYSVRAEVLVGGERRFITTQSYPVLTRDAPTHVDVMVMALKPETPAHSSLIGTHWALVELGGRPVAKTPTGREPYLMLLEEDARAVATGGCNQMSGRYRTADAALAFSQFETTKKACPDGMDRDQALAKALQSTAGYRIDGAHLEIVDASGAALARFEAAAVEE